MRNRTRQAVVAGGAGFLGPALCARLIETGFQVSCVDNFCSGRPAHIASLQGNPAFRFVDHDISEPLPELGDPDLVLHLASPASPPDYLRLPLQTLRAGSAGTEQLLELATRSGARFLLTSTSEVYGDPAEHPQTEDYWGHVNPIGPRSVYDEAKRYAESLTMAYHRTYGTDVGIARIFNTYGPGMRADDGRMIPAFISQALAGEPLTVTGDGEQTRSICYLDDTVAGLLALALSDVVGPINIGNPEERTVNQIAEAVRSGVGSSSPIRHIGQVQDDPRRRCPDITRARELLGWSPRIALSEGIRRTIAWFAATTDLAVPTSAEVHQRVSG